MNATAEIATMAVDDITVVDRHRMDLGDIAALARSIEAVGLLHPVVVTPDGRLVAGGRRVAAYYSLGRSRIPVTVADSLGDAHTALEAERDENTCRLDMKPTEKVALGRALEALNPRGQGMRTDLPTSENFPEVQRGETRDIVGEAVGMSGVTYQRAKAVVAAAEDESLPPEVRGEAVEAAAEMDRTGRVAPAFDRVRRAQTEAPELTGRDATRANAHKRRFIEAVSTVNGIGIGLDSLDMARVRAAMEPAEIDEWEALISKSLGRLRRLKNELREGGS
jgi:ParB family chromosome partitioning protein